jgi:putative ABC transport system permease protein
MSALVYALRMLRRDWRAGELRVLFAAVVVAVASVSAVGFFTDRIGKALERQASELLAADLVVDSDRPLEPVFAARAEALGLKTAEVRSFRSMVVAGEHHALAEAKAVSPAYPLRGALRTSTRPFGADSSATTVPAPGTAWIEVDLLRNLGLEVGDSLTLGGRELRVDRLLTYEPDRGGAMFSIAPRLLFNLADLPATGLDQEGSRIRYRMLVAGEQDAVNAFRAYADKRLGRGQKLLQVQDARQEVRDALVRARQFLGLAAMVSVVLAAVAVAMAARLHVERHIDNCAVMRCVGARQGFITGAYFGEMLALGLLGSVAGSVLGYAGHAVLVELLGRVMVAVLPPPSLAPVAFGMATGLLTLIAFALPPLLHLRRVPPLRVLRRELGGLAAPSASAYVLGVTALAGLLLWQAGDLRLGLYVGGGLLLTLAALALMALALVAGLNLLRGRAGMAWRFGLANVARRARSSIVQVLAFGVGIMSLLLLTVVRDDLLGMWQGRLPPQAPNRFLINIQPDQLQALGAFFDRHGLTPPRLYPMIRGRLIAINGAPVSGDDYEDGRARHLVEREFNLSWAAQPQDDNRIVAGRWWGDADHGRRLFSVEEGIAETLGIRLGDRLTYDIAGEEFTARVASLRKVQWDSFQANFFVVAPPGVLDAFPASYITSFYLPDGRGEMLAELAREFPNVTVIDVSAVMGKVRDIIQRVTQAVQYVFLFTLLAGLMVMFAALQATQRTRRREIAVLRALGARHRQLRLALLGEFVILGLIAGLVAAVAAGATGYVVAVYVLNLPYAFNPWLPVIGLAGGGLGVGLLGYLGAYRLLTTSPMKVLRATAA